MLIRVKYFVEFSRAIKILQIYRLHLTGNSTGGIENMNNVKEVARFPLMEMPIIAFILAIVAGSMDGYTYLMAKSFSTVMSGNIILLGQTLATNDLVKFTSIALIILCFGLGSGVTAVVQLHSLVKHKSWTAEILFIEAVILFVLGIKGINSAMGMTYVCMSISFLAGMQGNAFHKIDGMLYGNVAVTLVVQLAFSYIAQALFGKKGAAKNGFLYFQVLVGFAIGALMGTFSSLYWAEKSLWLTAVILLLMGVYTKVIKKEDSQEIVDPT